MSPISEILNEIFVAKAVIRYIVDKLVANARIRLIKYSISAPFAIDWK